MTTYLVTAWTPEDAPEEYTTPYCCWECLDRDNPHALSDQWIDERPSYEFDETCANCGALIPASR